MATLTRAHLARIAFPLALPMDKDVDVVPFDEDPFDRKFQLNILEGVEITMDFPLELIQIARGQQQGFQRSPISLDVGFPKRFDRLINPKNTVVVVFILQGFSGAPHRENQQKPQQQSTDAAAARCARVDHGEV